MQIIKEHHIIVKKINLKIMELATSSMSIIKEGPVTCWSPEVSWTQDLKATAPQPKHWYTRSIHTFTKNF